MGDLLELGFHRLDQLLAIDRCAQQRLEDRQKILSLGKRKSAGRHKYLAYFNIRSPVDRVENKEEERAAGPKIPGHKRLPSVGKDRQRPEKLQLPLWRCLNGEMLSAAFVP
jgi:hypothetical protein